MLGNRLKKLRKEQFMSLADVSEAVAKSPSTLSRYENNLVEKIDLDLIEKLAVVLDTSSAYLLGLTDDCRYLSDIKTTKYFINHDLTNVLVTDDLMAPEIPEGACVQIRQLEANEDLAIGGYYYIEFNNHKSFRMVIDDHLHGLGFLPADMSERRIAFDREYVKVIGKAVSMKVFFEDQSNEL